MRVPPVAPDVSVTESPGEKLPKEAATAAAKCSQRAKSSAVQTHAAHPRSSEQTDLGAVAADRRDARLVRTLYVLASLPLSDEVLYHPLPQRLFDINAFSLAQRARRRDETLEVAEGVGLCWRGWVLRGRDNRQLRERRKGAGTTSLLHEQHANVCVDAALHEGEAVGHRSVGDLHNSKHARPGSRRVCCSGGWEGDGAARSSQPPAHQAIDGCDVATRPPNEVLQRSFVLSVRLAPTSSSAGKLHLRVCLRQRLARLGALLSPALSLEQRSSAFAKGFAEGLPLQGLGLVDN